MTKRLTIDVEIDNAAFTGSDPDDSVDVAFYTADELRGVLTRVADNVSEGRDYGPVIDSNGNTVGRWSIASD